MKNDFNWKVLGERQGWITDLFNQKNLKPDSYYRSLFLQAKRYIPRIKSNCFSKSVSTEQLLEIPIDDRKIFTAIAVNDENICVGTSAGNIKIMNRKGPIQWNTLEHSDYLINALQGRFL